MKITIKRDRTNLKRVQVFSVGKIWAVKRSNSSKVFLYTEKKSEAKKVATDLVNGNTSLVEFVN